MQFNFAIFLSFVLIICLFVDNFYHFIVTDFTALSFLFYLFSLLLCGFFFVLFLFALPTHLYPSVSEMIQFSQMTLVSSDTGVFLLLVCYIIPLSTRSQQYPTVRDIKVTKSGLEVGLESTVSGTTVQILFRHLCFSLFLLTCQMG